MKKIIAFLFILSCYPIAYQMPSSAEFIHDFLSPSWYYPEKMDEKTRVEIELQIVQIATAIDEGNVRNFTSILYTLAEDSDVLDYIYIGLMFRTVMTQQYQMLERLLILSNQKSGYFDEYTAEVIGRTIGEPAGEELTKYYHQLMEVFICDASSRPWHLSKYLGITPMSRLIDFEQEKFIRAVLEGHWFDAQEIVMDLEEALKKRKPQIALIFYYHLCDKLSPDCSQEDRLEFTAQILDMGVAYGCKELIKACLNSGGKITQHHIDLAAENGRNGIINFLRKHLI